MIASNARDTRSSYSHLVPTYEYVYSTALHFISPSTIYFLSIHYQTTFIKHRINGLTVFQLWSGVFCHNIHNFTKNNSFQSGNAPNTTNLVQRFCFNSGWTFPNKIFHKYFWYIHGQAFHTLPAWLIWIISGFPSDFFNLFAFVRPLIAFYPARDSRAPAPAPVPHRKYVYRAPNFPSYLWYSFERKKEAK